MFFLVFIECKSQVKNLDSLKVVYLERKSLEHQQLIQLTKDKKSWKWLNLIPSVNVSSHYDPFTQIYRPAISFNFSISKIAQFHQNNVKNRIEREKLKMTLYDALMRENNTISTEILNIQKDSISITYEENNVKILEELYKLKTKAYEVNKINLEEKLNQDLKINQVRNNLKIRKLNYINRRKKLINLLTKKSTTIIKEVEVL